MTGTLFDTATLDPGTRGRFAEDRWAPFRIVVHRWVQIEEGPMVAVDELAMLVGRLLDHWGVTVHQTTEDVEWLDDDRPDFRGHYIVVDCSLLAESHAHANELFAGLADRALRTLEDQWEWFEHNPASKWRPGGET